MNYIDLSRTDGTHELRLSGKNEARADAYQLWEPLNAANVVTRA